MGKLILTGCGGHLGSRVLTHLLTHNLIPTSDLIISTSNASKLPQTVKDTNIEIRHGDFTSPSAPSDLTSTFRGATVLFLISFPSPSVSRWEHHRTAIDAAKASGVQTVIYTSLMFGGEAGTSSVAVVQQAHIRTIAYLQQSGLKYVIVREGIYAESWWLYAGFQPREGYPAPRSGSNGVALDGHDEGLKEQGDKGVIEWVIPADGPVAWVSWTELAEATALILAEYEKYIGQTLNLTGCETKTITQLAEVGGAGDGEKSGYQDLGDGGSGTVPEGAEGGAGREFLDCGCVGNVSRGIGERGDGGGGWVAGETHWAEAQNDGGDGGNTVRRAVNATIEQVEPHPKVALSRHLGREQGRM